MVLVFADKNKIILYVDTSGHLVGKLRKAKENDNFDMGVKGFRDRSSPEGGGGGSGVF